MRACTETTIQPITERQTLKAIREPYDGPHNRLFGRLLRASSLVVCCVFMWPNAVCFGADGGYAGIATNSDRLIGFDFIFYEPQSSTHIRTLSDVLGVIRGDFRYSPDFDTRLLDPAFETVLETNTFLMSFTDVPPSEVFSWLAHLSGVSLRRKAAGTFRFMPSKDGDPVIADLWKRTNGPAELAINKRLDSRCDAPSKPIGLYEFIKPWLITAGGMSVVIESSTDVSACWTNKCIQASAGTSWRGVLDEVLPRYGLAYSVQGSAILIRASATRHVESDVLTTASTTRTNRKRRP